MQPQIGNEDVVWSPWCNMPTTRTNERRALSLQEVELDGWFLILHIVLETCTIWFMHEFRMSFVFHFYVLRLTSWIWTGPSTEELKFESPSKRKSYEGFNLEHCLDDIIFKFIWHPKLALVWFTQGDLVETNRRQTWIGGSSSFCSFMLNE